MKAKNFPKVSKIRNKADNKGQNPIYKKGERNIFCPHYRSCLDHAIHKSWEFWACLECRHQMDTQSFEDFSFTHSEQILYHSLPQEIYAKVG